MKVLYYIGYPLFWARGGHEQQIRESERCLKERGVEIRWLHHDAENIEDADILHYWGRPPTDFHWELAKARGLKVVISEMFPAGVSRPRWVWKFRGYVREFLARAGGELYRGLGAGIYKGGDAAIALTPYEADYMVEVFGAHRDRVVSIPNGVVEAYFREDIEPIPFEGLIYSAFISRHKNCVEVARAAKKFGVPIKFIGGAQVHDPEYLDAFKKEVDGQTVLWTGRASGPEEIAAHLRGSKGVVLAGKFEAMGLSTLEGLQCGLPAMVSDLPNLKAFYGESVYYSRPGHRPGFGEDLRNFWNDCREERAAKPPFHVWSWAEVAEALHQVYEGVLRASPFALLR
jgi:glycosyltransferase involved in cell wall biosynthesis